MHKFTRKLSLYVGPWLMPLLLLLVQSAQAQTTRDMIIRGKVTAAETNEGIPGVNIIIKNSKQGATTQAEGTFSLNVPERPSVLLISYIGYQTQEVTVNTESTITVSLQADTRSLNEVVVVGYGTQKKRDMTGAVSSIGSDLFKERRETQVAQSLQGAMSGVVVSRNGSSATSSK